MAFSAFEIIAQDMKVIDMKRRAIAKDKAKLPFLYPPLIIFIILFIVAVSRLALPMAILMGIFVAAIFAQIGGPTGSKTRIRRALEDVEKKLISLSPKLKELPVNEKIAIFAVGKVSRTEIPISNVRLLTADTLAEINERGQIGETDYKWLGVAQVGPDGSLDVSDRDIQKHPWFLEARKKKHSVDAINAALPKLG